MVGFSGISGTGQAEDQKMIKDNLIDEKNYEQVRVKLLKMIRDAGGKFDDY